MGKALSWRERRRRSRLFRGEKGLRAFLEAEFRDHMGFSADLAAPARLSERLLALRLTDRDPLLPVLAPYPAQLEYLRAKKQDRALPRVYAEGGSLRDILKAALPERALLRPTHLPEGGLPLTAENRREAARAARAWLGESAFLSRGAWEYRAARPGLAAQEEPSGERVCVLCLGGEPRVLYRPERPRALFDETGQALCGGAEPFRPDGLERAAALCRALAEGLPFLRVELALAGGRPLFCALRFFEDWEVLAAMPAGLDGELGSFLPLPRGRE